MYTKEEDLKVTISMSRYMELKLAERKMQGRKFRFRIPFPATATIHSYLTPRDNLMITFNKKKLIKYFEEMQKEHVINNYTIKGVFKSLDDFYNELIKVKSFSCREFRRWRKTAKIEKMEYLNKYNYVFPEIHIS